MVADGADLPDDTLTALITAELDGRVLTDEDVLGFMMFPVSYTHLTLPTILLV